MLIASAGKDLSSTTTRDKVHEQFGQPSATVFSDGEFSETFRTRQKIFDEGHKERVDLDLRLSFFLGDFPMFLGELFDLGYLALLGQDLRFVYDTNGKVREVFINGEKRYTPQRPKNQD